MAYPTTILADLAQSLLEVGVAALTDAGLEVPERTFVSHGQPPGEPTECAETLASWIGAISIPPKPPGGFSAGCATKSVVTLNLTLYRCVPNLTSAGPPSALELDASGKALAEDAWVLWFGILSGWYDGSLFDGLGLACTAFDPSGGQISLPPQGNLAGWNFSGRLTL